MEKRWKKGSLKDGYPKIRVSQSWDPLEKHNEAIRQGKVESGKGRAVDRLDAASEMEAKQRQVQVAVEEEESDIEADVESDEEEKDEGLGLKSKHDGIEEKEELIKRTFFGKLEQLDKIFARIV